MNKKRIMYLIEEYATARKLVHIHGDRDDLQGMKRNYDIGKKTRDEIESELDAINDVAEHYRREACKLADMYNELASKSVDVTNPTGRHE